MTGDTRRRGGAPVGYMAELPEIEASAISYLRCWCEGPDWQDALRDEFKSKLGHRHGGRGVDALNRLCQLLALHGRRPLLRHHVQCRCFGGDESAFANCVGAIVAGDREDAELFAALIVDHRVSGQFVAEAEAFGVAAQLLASDPGLPHSSSSSNVVHLH
ncbi:MAG: hypothetical protein AAGF44_09830 [Pseudomonadota bacterium]